MNQFQPDYKVPPGKTLKEIIDNGVCVKNFSPEELQQILDGHKIISAECAQRIAKDTNTSPTFWINREAHYRSPKLAAVISSVSKYGIHPIFMSDSKVLYERGVQVELEDSTFRVSQNGERFTSFYTSSKECATFLLGLMYEDQTDIQEKLNLEIQRLNGELNEFFQLECKFEDSKTTFEQEIEDALELLKTGDTQAAIEILNEALYDLF